MSSTALQRDRDTPTRSPFARTPNPRSPTKATRQEKGLSLQKVIGNTCTSANHFDAHAPTNSFCYAAGAAAVVATIDDNSKISQCFYRAHASQYTVSKPSIISPSVHTPGGYDLRSRLVQRNAREDSPAESPGGRTGHAKDRVKAVTTVTLSPDGRWLAVGETGYKPRVLLFAASTKTSSDTPCSIISEHSFGVHAVAFSADSRLLATLGTVNDGFLFIWEIDDRTGAATLLASNKCINIVNRIAFIGRNLVTVGVRFVKVWRPDDLAPSTTSKESHPYSHSAPRPLAGRNTLLGDLADCNFSVAVSRSDTQAVLATDRGDVCLLDDTDKQQRLVPCHTTGYGITSACILKNDILLISSREGRIEEFSLNELQRADTPVPDQRSRNDAPLTTPKTLSTRQAVHAVAIAALPDVLVLVDNTRRIQLRKLDGNGEQTSSRLTTLPAHADPVIGCRSVVAQDQTSSFLTWSAGGSVLAWTADGELAHCVKIPIEMGQELDFENELKSVDALPGMQSVVSGDRYGVIRVSSLQDGTTSREVRAHASEITDVVILSMGSTTYVLTAGRDRSIQVFGWTGADLQLLQTLNEHAGAVVSVLPADSAKALLSISVDRTLVVRDAVESNDKHSLFAVSRIVSLKSTPVAMCAAVYPHTVLVSTADKQVHLVDYSSAQITHTFKASDLEGGDSVVLSSIVHLSFPSSPPVVAGISSDKSVRLYLEDGTLLARDTGHTGGVTDIAMISSRSQNSTPTLVTVALDGTTFIWQIAAPTPPVSSAQASIYASESNASVASPLSRPPLRKVVSQAEIARIRYSRSPTEEPEPNTPTGVRSPPPASDRVLRKRPSRLNVSQATRLAPTTPRGEIADPLASPRSRRSPSPLGTRTPTRSTARSPSRSPTRTPTYHNLPAVNTMSHKKPHLPAAGNLGLNDAEHHDMSAQDISQNLCRLLVAYRQGIGRTYDPQLESELQATLNAIRNVRPPLPTMNSSGKEVVAGSNQPGNDMQGSTTSDDLVGSLGAMSLHERFEGLRSKSSDSVPLAAAVGGSEDDRGVSA